jgi:hypothetical protein
MKKEYAMSPTQPHPPLLSLAARIVLATAIGTAASFVDFQFAYYQVGGLSMVVIIAFGLIALLALSVLTERAFWQERRSTQQRLIGSAIVIALLLLVALLLVPIGAALIIPLIPLVAAFVTRYPGQPTYDTGRFAAWCGGASWLGSGIMYSYPLLTPHSLSDGLVVVVLFAWLFGLGFALSLAVLGVSLRFMRPIISMQPIVGRHAKLRIPNRR